MLSINECRKILGNKYKNYTDEQIKQLRDCLMELAKINAQIIQQHLSKGTIK